MKKFSQLIKEAKELDIQDDSVNYLSAKELQDYLKIADKFISEETKKICNWLIEHNAEYIKKLSTGKTDNALVDFFNAGSPADKSLKELYTWIAAVAKSNRILEIPVFMTRTQFDSIIDKKASPDEVILDLDSEAGRNAIAKKYDPLVHKVVKSFIGVSSFEYDDLYAYGLEGLVYAMNTYGKKSNKLKKKEEEMGYEADISNYKSYTFLQYAGQMIRCRILDAIKSESQLVRIPISQQKKMKETNGFIPKSNTVSGDTGLGSKDGGEGKTLFELIGGMENPGKSIDREEIESLWDKIMQTLTDKFGEKTMDIFKNHFGFGLKGNQEKLSGKEMAQKYGYSSPSSITAEITKVINFIKKDKAMYQRFVDVFELMKEAKHDEDEYSNDDNEPVSVSSLLVQERLTGVNNIDGN